MTSPHNSSFPQQPHLPSQHHRQRSAETSLLQTLETQLEIPKDPPCKSESEHYTMVEVEIAAPVNHCRWIMVKKNDGTKRRLKVGDCHRVVCQYSIDFRLPSCRCL